MKIVVKDYIKELKKNWQPSAIVLKYKKEIANVKMVLDILGYSLIIGGFFLLLIRTLLR